MLGAGALVWALLASSASAPSLSTLSATIIDPAGGDVVTATGANLGSATGCTVGGVAATLGTNTSSSLVFTAPALALAAMPAFDGVNKKLTTAGASSNYQAASAYAGWAVIYPDAIPAAGGAFYDGHSVIGTATNGYWLLTLRTVSGTSYVGIRHVQQASGTAVTVETAITPSAWHLIQWNYDGTTLKIRVDGGSWASVAATALDPTGLGQSLALGVTAYSTAYVGKIAEIGLLASSLSDANHNNVIAAVNTEYRMGFGGVSGTAFDRSTLTLAGWWRKGSYAVGTWSGSASAGSSGSRSATEATNQPTVSTPPWVGSHPVVVTTAAGSSNALSLEAFADTGLVLAGLYRNYGPAGTWTGLASMGTSSAKSLVQATASLQPSVGTSIRGDAAAVFDGSNDELGASANFWSQYLNTSTAINATFWVLVNVASGTLAADPGAGSRYLAAGLLADTGSGAIGLTVHTGGVTLLATDGSFKEATAAFAAGSWQLVQCKMSPTALAVRVNGGAWSTTAWSPNASQPSLETRGVRVGKNYNATTVNAQMRVLAFAKDQQLADAVLDKVRGQYATRYGITI